MIYRMRTGCQWNQLPKDFPDDSSIHRTMQRWIERGVFSAIWTDLAEACAEQFVLGDNLSFTPWHSLPEHRPLGGVNQARKIVYEALSKFRHQQNEAPRKEPTGFAPF